ncbi:MAG: SMC-Scp complex subunit ScpB [Clostridia bacterium]|nr:SMC-Scp complex subunit ScpB [Clostridia bacterium]
MTQEILDTEHIEERPADHAVTPENALQSIADMEAALEAILFAAGYPVPYKKIGEVLGLPATDVRTLAEHMAPVFNSADAHRGVQMLLFPDTCQICTREEFAPYIREVLGVRRGGNLSAASMEVLAVIAYNQPVTRTFIDTVRGVDSSYAVNSLLDKELIRAVGRLEVVGRPMLYGTTDKFLRVFGISSLEELPATEALAVAAQMESQQSEKAAENEEQRQEDRENDPPTEEQQAPTA